MAGPTRVVSTEPLACNDEPLLGVPPAEQGTFPRVSPVQQTVPADDMQTVALISHVSEQDGFDYFLWTSNLDERLHW